MQYETDGLPLSHAKFAEKRNHKDTMKITQNL